MRLDPKLFDLTVDQQMQLLVRHEQDKRLSTEEIKALLLNTCIEVMTLDNKIRGLLSGKYQADCYQKTDSEDRI